MRAAPTDVRVPLAWTIFGILTLTVPVVAWTAPVCQVPNTQMKLCHDIGQFEFLSCSSGNDAQPLCVTFQMIQVNLFPVGPVKSQKGSTSEEEAECWRKQSCIYNPVNKTCSPTGNWSPWYNGDKTIVGENPCPVGEG
jgi:hypothetical protein